MRAGFAVLGILPAGVLLTGLTLTAAAEPEPKGARAILIDGGLLEAAVRIHDDAQATSLMIGLMRSFGEAEPAPAVAVPAANRACLRISVILPLHDLEGVADADLTPEHAGFTYWFYPAAGDSPASVMAGESDLVDMDKGAAFPVAEWILADLTRRGVPSSIGADAKSRERRCARPLT